MRTENTAINMQFINDNVFEIDEEFLPFGVMRQNAGMQHVGIGDDYMPLFADGLTRIVRRIAIIGESFNVGLQVGNQAVNLVHLVLRQRFGRE